MHDTMEQVWINVFDGERIGVGRILDVPYEETPEDSALRVCTIMARAIGQELGYLFDGKTAGMYLRQMSRIALQEAAFTLEKKNGKKAEIADRDAEGEKDADR